MENTENSNTYYRVSKRGERYEASQLTGYSSRHEPSIEKRDIPKISHYFEVADYLIIKGEEITIKPFNGSTPFNVVKVLEVYPIYPMEFISFDAVGGIIKIKVTGPDYDIEYRGRKNPLKTLNYFNGLQTSIEEVYIDSNKYSHSCYPSKYGIYLEPSKLSNYSEMLEEYNKVNDTYEATYAEFKDIENSLIVAEVRFSHKTKKDEIREIHNLKITEIEIEKAYNRINIKFDNSFDSRFKKLNSINYISFKSLKNIKGLIEISKSLETKIEEYKPSKDYYEKHYLNVVYFKEVVYENYVLNIQGTEIIEAFKKEEKIIDCLLEGNEDDIISEMINKIEW